MVQSFFFLLGARYKLCRMNQIVDAYKMGIIFLNEKVEHIHSLQKLTLCKLNERSRSTKAHIIYKCTKIKAKITQNADH